MSGKKVQIVLSVVLFVLGAALVIGAFAYRGKNRQKIKTFIRTSATVIDYDERRERDDNGRYKYLYASIVSYEVDGEQYTAADNVYSNVRRSRGSKVEIAYNPHNPNQCIFIKSSNTGFIIMLVAGGVFALAGVTVFIMALKNQ